MALVGFVGLCLLVALAGGAIARTSVKTWYATLAAPPGTPPAWIFAPVWAVLYLLIGVAGWLVWRRSGAARPVRLWGWQLLFNALWTPAFFGLHSPSLALIDILLLLAVAALTLRDFAEVRPVAAWMFTPYFGWTCYAAYLNAGFWWLNPS
ncbi:MAG: tryptophan-rich sensory protein [Acetobacteraceae bacterium]|nr:tryptophan-rich sensory protein [Acetobacteraceae bacterium]